MSEEKKDKVFTKGLFANEKSGKHGSFINIDFKTEDFKKFLDENTDEKGYCKITLYKNKTDSAAKNTHYGCLNDFKPTVQPVGGKKQDPVAAEADDLPF